MQTKKFLALFLTVVMVIGFVPMTVFATEAPVANLEIGTVEELKDFAAAVNAGDNFAGKTVVLTANIDLTDETWTPITSFAGTFDGQNYTISNLTNAACLFNTVTAAGTVQNLKLDQITADFAASVKYGFLAITVEGQATNCHVSNVTVSRAGYSNAKGGTLIYSVTGNAVVDGCSVSNVTVNHAANAANTDCVDGLGGVFGGIGGNATVKNCSGTNITMNFANKTKRVGGFAEGISNTAKVENCTLTDFTIGSKEGDGYLQEVGGFAANVSGGTISDCTVEDATFLTGRVSRQTGGFVGQATGGTFNTCNVIDVTIDVTARGTNTIGSTSGFCGQTNGNDAKAFNNCSVTGLDMTVTGGLENGIGGFLTSTGGNGAVNITGCSATGNIDATETGADDAVGGFLGNLGWGGSAAVSVNSSSADVDITANGPVGGFVANADSTSSSATPTLTVTQSTASGNVESLSSTADAFVATGDKTDDIGEECTGSGEVVSADPSITNSAACNPSHSGLGYSSVIFGEVVVTNGIGIKSLVIELYAGDEKLATTNVNNISGFLDAGDVKALSWHILVKEGTYVDEYWTTNWMTEPVSTKVPTHIVTYVNDVNVGETPVSYDYDGGTIVTEWKDMPGVYNPPVAMIGEAEYLTVQAAVDAANAGETIVLVSDVSETDITVAADDDVIIDFGGYTVTGDFMVYGKAVIKNGTILNDAFVSGIESNGASADLTTEDLTVTSDRHALRIDGGKAHIISGNYTSTADGSSCYAVNAGGDIATMLIIDGGTFTSDEKASTQGTALMLKNELVTTIVNGGTFNSADIYSFENYGTMTITGGDFAEGFVASGSTTISGGTFGKDPTAYVVEEYVATEENGVWTVAEAAEPALDMEVPTEYLATGDTITVTVKNAGRNIYGLKYTLNYDASLFTLTSGNVDFDNSATGTVNAIATGEVIATYTFTYNGKAEATAPFTAEFSVTGISATTTSVADGDAKVLTDVKKSVDLKGIFNDTYVTAVTDADYNGNEIVSATENDLPEGAEVEYTVDNGTPSSEIPVFTVAGEYTVNYTITCENYETYTGSYTFTISKLAVTITPDNLSKTFGDADPVLTGKVTYTESGEAVVDEAILAALGVTYSREKGEAVGTYVISASNTADTENYTVTTVTALLTINASELTIVKLENYADGKTLYLVCTNDNVAVKLGNNMLYEMEDIKSASAYAEVAEFAHVYGWVALNDTVLTADSFTVVVYENVEILTHGNDVNNNGNFDFADRVCVGAVYNGNGAYFAEKYMHILLGADVNMDGVVDAMDAPALN